jgi:hypothetical protein
MEESVLIMLAGPIAQARHGRVSLAATYLGGGESDFRYVKQCLSEYGIENLFGEFERRAKELVRQKWKAIMAVADQLLRHRKLSFDQVEQTISRTEADIATSGVNSLPTYQMGNDT